MSSSTTAPSVLDLLASAFVLSSTEAESLHISGGLISATVRSAWVWFKFFVAVLRIALVAFVWGTNKAMRLKPVARAASESFFSDTLSATEGLSDLDRAWELSKDLKSTLDS